MQSTWTSLEFTKLVVATLTPLAVVFLGLWVNRVAKRIEAAQWANQKLIEKRIAIYEKLAPLINDLYCFYMCVGHWKDLTPIQIVEIKRKLDKEVHIYSSLFSPEFVRFYNAFIDACFVTYAGAGHDARLRTLIEHTKGGDRRKSTSVPWKTEWDALFSGKEGCYPLQQVRTAYEELMFRFSKELGVSHEQTEQSTN